MIDPNEKQVLADLVAIMDTLDLPMMVVGAGARLLIFDQRFGAGRGTKDWDVAISIDSWTVYETLRTTLIQSNSNTPCFKSTSSDHKFIHVATNIEVDIVPFGAIGAPDQQIIWPDSGNPMNVWGFAEALDQAKTISIDDLELQVVDIPAFLVLKIFAWGDRGDRTNKDLEDLELVLSKYEDDDRIYDELSTELSDGTVDFLDAHIYLLGQDIHQILRPSTLYELNILLPKLMNKLGDQPRTLGYRLSILAAGINSCQR
jgi:predicted nucleotidyltransferase